MTPLTMSTATATAKDHPRLCRKTRARPRVATSGGSRRNSRKTSLWLARRTPAGARADVAKRSAPSVVREVADQAGRLGIELVDVASNIDVLSVTAAQLSDTFGRLHQAAGQLQVGNASVSVAAEAVLGSSQQAAADVHASQVAARDSCGDSHAHRLGDSIGEELDCARRALDGIGAVAQQINAISERTHILAPNARIETARSGEAGKGFTVIADNVRQLADEAIGAAGHIDATLGRLGEQLDVLAEHGGEARGHAEAAEDATGSIGRVLDSFGTAMTGVEQQVSAIAHVATRSTRQIEEFMTGLTGLVNSVEVSSGELDTARTRVYSLLDVSETLIGGIASMGAVTSDTAFITAAQEAAAEISRLFEAAVASGTMRLEDLFDQDYRTVAGSNPVQHMTRFTTFTDRVLPAVQEPLLAIDDRVTFAAAVDRNGYLPTHKPEVLSAAGSRPGLEHRALAEPPDLRRPHRPGRGAQHQAFSSCRLSPGHGRWQLRAHEGRLRTDHRRRPALGRPASGLSRAVSR